MKTLEQILKQDAVYLNDWSDKIGVISDFDNVYMSKEEYEATEPPYPNSKMWLEKKRKMKNAIEGWKEINILFATYSYQNYSGDAWVLFEQGGKLYEVNGGHCSCYGLEGQWSPEKVTLEVLEHRLLNGTFGGDYYCGNQFKKELCDFLGVEVQL